MPTSSLPPVFDKSAYLELRVTSRGGRSLFAVCDIEQGTRVHSSEGPFAHVIYKDYRKEVCAQCFAYSASDRAPLSVGTSRTWNIKWSRVGAATAWFCSDACKDGWERDEVSLLLAEVDALLTKGQVATRKRLKPAEAAKIKPLFPSFEPADGTLAQETIDGAWESALALAASRAQLAIYCSTLHIEDMELEIARSLAAAIVRRYCDDGLASSDLASPVMREHRSEPWARLLDLQTSERCNVRTRPYMLMAHLRVYVFLSNVLPKYLRKYMSTVREVLARDTGNAFGIWDGDRRDEMMGWGIWVDASYFNHSCTPNVLKKREGRTLHFEAMRRIRAGEELCISYIDTDLPVDQRRRELETSWFFTCYCPRCEADTSV